MVNTFLPFPDYQKVARMRDAKRLGKQRVEAYQILRINLGIANGGGWKNHPAAVMWRGHEGMLCVYILAMCNRWVALGYQDTIADKVVEIMNNLDQSTFTNPWWMGNEEFHKSHRSNLVRKLPKHYRRFVEKGLRSNLPYKWPKPDGTLAVTKPKEKKKKGNHVSNQVS